MIRSRLHIFANHRLTHVVRRGRRGPSMREKLCVLLRLENNQRHRPVSCGHLLPRLNADTNWRMARDPCGIQHFGVLADFAARGMLGEDPPRGRRNYPIDAGELVRPRVEMGGCLQLEFGRKS
eukprot:4255405-Pyramimonas_sp.AAC.1